MGQMTEFNKEDVQTELRLVIADAHANQRLWTTDWAGVQLKRYAVITYIPRDVVESSRRLPLGQFDAEASAYGKFSETQDVSLSCCTPVDDQRFMTSLSSFSIGMITHLKITRKLRRMHSRMQMRPQMPWTQVTKQLSTGVHSVSSVNMKLNGKRTMAVAMAAVSRQITTIHIFLRAECRRARLHLGVLVGMMIQRPIRYAPGTDNVGDCN